MLLDQVIEDLTGAGAGEEDSPTGLPQNSEEARKARPAKKGRLFRLMEDMND